MAKFHIGDIVEVYKAENTGYTHSKNGSWGIVVGYMDNIRDDDDDYGEDNWLEEEDNDVHVKFFLCTGSDITNRTTPTYWINPDVLRLRLVGPVHPRQHIYTKIKYLEDKQKGVSLNYDF